MRTGTGLVLCGGGYRAMLFHVGVLWRLNELGWLPKLTTVSSVSTSSITAGVLAQAWTKLRFDDTGIAENLDVELIAPLRNLARTTLDTTVLLRTMVFPWRRTGNELANAYAKLIFGDRVLTELAADGPRFVFTAADTRDGTLRFLESEHHGRVRLASVIAASTAFPLLGPVVSPALQDSVGKMELCEVAACDNLGLDPVESDCATILVSDATKPIPTQLRSWPREQLEALQFDDSNMKREQRIGTLLHAYTWKSVAGAYWSINSDIATVDLFDALPAPAVMTRALARTPTRLARIAERSQERLINWGYAVCDAGMRRWVVSDAEGPESYPYPNSGVG